MFTPAETSSGGSTPHSGSRAPPLRRALYRRRAGVMILPLVALAAVLCMYRVQFTITPRFQSQSSHTVKNPEEAVSILQSWTDSDPRVSASDREAAAMLTGLLEQDAEADAPAAHLRGVLPRRHGGNSTARHVDAQSVWRPRLALPPAIRQRCEGTFGDWCGGYLQQKPIPVKPPPHGNMTCPSDCNGVGTCQADFGYCQCPAGWTGEGCTERLLRPCTKKYRESGNEPDTSGSFPLSEPGWTMSRCPGVCDEELAICYCNGTLGRIPAPEGSPPGTPPIRVGRPFQDCRPARDENGDTMSWVDEGVPNELLFGPDGWCSAAEPQHQCPCITDGFTGPFCDIPVEQTCANQCNGRGDCYFGFCRCMDGWYGHDCAQIREGHVVIPGLEEERPWLKPHIRTPAAEDPPSRTERLRPLIYVHDMPAAYNTRMLQYRADAAQGFYRAYLEGNVTEVPHGLYLAETAFHEMMLQSEHRTLDIEEADLFYVPVYVNLYVWPIFGWSDGPWWHSATIDGPRVMHAANMMLEAKRWIEMTHPAVWKRRGGRDHIWLVPNDEGGCWVPHEVWPGIILSHWGRRDEEHTSNTAYEQDDYSIKWKDEWQKRDWTAIHSEPRQHPCYDPDKDLLVPTIHVPREFAGSPLLGAAPKERNILLFFKGDVGEERLPRYSRGIRQRLHSLATEQGWREKHKIHIDGYGEDADIPYTELLASSIFCVAVPGDGFARRAEEAVLHGCIPLLIMDNVDEKFANVVDYSEISMHVAENELESLPDVLKAVPPERLHEMQRNIGKIWHRFVYANIPLYESEMEEFTEENLRNSEHSEPPASLPDRFEGARDSRTEERLDSYKPDDAWSTILQWLYYRMEQIHAEFP